MQVRPLRGVVADDEPHFRRAAERLHDGPPAVSQQLHKLETELGGLADELATLRRLATLAARGAPPAEVFEAVIAQIGRLFAADAAALGRYEADGTFTAIGLWGRADGYVHSGARHPTEGRNLARLILETRGPARIDSYAAAAGSLATAARDRGWRLSVGAPVIVVGRIWGMVAVASTTERPLLPDAEGRLAEFTELLAAAIANAQSREDLTRLAKEQAALRRVATLVARGAHQKASSPSSPSRSRAPCMSRW